MPHTTKRQRRAAPPSLAVAETSFAGPSQPPVPSPSSTASSRLFAPFRALGLVTDHVPFSLFVHTPKGALATPTAHIVTSVGRSWMMWEAGRMGLVFVGPDAGHQITSLAQTGTEIFAAAGAKVIKYIRGKPVGTFESPDASFLGKILIFGEQLLALKEDGTGLYIWDMKTRDLQNEITFHTSFIATTLLHPATYLNKVLIGSQQGELQLWNIRTCSMIHSFPPTNTASPSPITSLIQSPAVDVVGVGHLDGTAKVFDIRQGELIMQVKMDDGGVSSLAFRMDGPPILATASSAGSLAMWDLSKGGRLLHVLRGAHEQSVTGLEWVAGQPLLITSSGDNSVKQWLFDSPDAVPRLLKFRGGHHAPPACIRYYGDDGKQILTAGRDRALRYTSVVRDSRSHELSQGSFHKRAIGLEVSVSQLKYPTINAISSSSTRSKDWEDVITSHAEDACARTWRVQKKRLGPSVFEMDEGVVQAVCVTACGNFGVVGSSTGEIRMWNMQSGKERKSFSLTGSPEGTTKPRVALNRTRKIKVARKEITAVTGLVTDALNTMVIASTLEGKLYMFDFHTTRLIHEVQLPCPVTALSLHRDSGLLAATCDDLTVRLVDIETRRVVRELRGFKGRILDTAFSHDSRWLITTSLDSIIRTYDIPTGRLVDAFRTLSIATSITFSPTGDFLATAHIDSVGIHLWANRAQFSDVALRHITEDDEVQEVGMPSVQGIDDENFQNLEPVGAPEFTDTYTTPDQLADGLLTLSVMPRSRWQTLLNLETIRQRNKPIQPPKAPEAAPFFLPTISGLETHFELPNSKSALKPNGAGVDGGKPNGDHSSDWAIESGEQSLTEGGDHSRILGSGTVLESEFTRMLMKADKDGEYTSFFQHALTLPPSLLDLEIRSLATLPLLSTFINALTHRLVSQKDYEAVQAILSVFLSVHGDVLVGNEELGEGLQGLKEAVGREGERLEGLVGFALGTLGYLRGGG